VESINGEAVIFPEANESKVSLDATPSGSNRVELINGKSTPPETGPGNKKDLDKPSLPVRHSIKGIPFVKQWEAYCLPACIEMILKYHHCPLSQESLKLASLDGTPFTGTSAEDMESALNLVGIKTKLIHGNLTDLKKYIAKDVPVIVLQWADLDRQNRHARIAAGFDDMTKEVICIDPSVGPDYRIPYDEFIKLWDTEMFVDTTKYEMLVINPEKEDLSRMSTAGSQKKFPRDLLLFVSIALAIAGVIIYFFVKSLR
jgi:ABC-type bacteriocin/lantibiotic exporter with double-glycine peptidase domain